MLCSKIEAFHAVGTDAMLPPNGRVSPVFDFMSSIPENERTRFINYACYSELSRYCKRKSNEPMLMHPVMYNEVKSQSRCPCGSTRKFKNCCRPLLDSHCVEDNIFDYPMKAEFSNPSMDAMFME